MLDKDTVNRMADLLNVVEKIANVAPGFMNISGEAMAELREIDAAIRERKLAESTKPVPALAGQPTDDPQPSTPVDEPLSEVTQSAVIPSSRFPQLRTGEDDE